MNYPETNQSSFIRTQETSQALWQLLVALAVLFAGAINLVTY